MKILLVLSPITSRYLAIGGSFRPTLSVYSRPGGLLNGEEYARSGDLFAPLPAAARAPGNVT